jgi:uncharacterized protein YciW
LQKQTLLAEKTKHTNVNGEHQTYQTRLPPRPSKPRPLSTLERPSQIDSNARLLVLSALQHARLLVLSALQQLQADAQNMDTRFM